MYTQMEVKPETEIDSTYKNVLYFFIKLILPIGFKSIKFVFINTLVMVNICTGY